MYDIIPEADNPILREIAQEIAAADIPSAKIKTLIKEMKKLLSKEEYGVALAAPQVGESLKLFVVSGRAVAKRSKSSKKIGRSKEDESSKNSEMSSEDMVYINPVLLKVSKQKKNKHEGCLSIRGSWGVVSRSEKATIKALDENGKSITRGASGFLAHIFQHEMDHLEGILYTDKAAELYDDEAESGE